MPRPIGGQISTRYPSISGGAVWSPRDGGIARAPFFTGSALTWLASNYAVVTASSSATANTVGAWSQIFSSSVVSSTDTVSVLLVGTASPSASSATDNRSMLDFATGEAGQEVVIAQDLAVGGLTNTPLVFALPVRIAGATRIAFRARCATGSRSLRTTFVQLFSAPFADRIPTLLDTIGVTQSTSSGTAMTGSAGTWTQITAATTKDYQALILLPSGAANFSGGASTTQRLDLGIGAAGSEVAISSCNLDQNLNGVLLPQWGLPGLVGVCGRAIPAGTRIAVRHDRASNPSWLAACVIGVPYV